MKKISFIYLGGFSYQSFVETIVLCYRMSPTSHGGKGKSRVTVFHNAFE